MGLRIQNSDKSTGTEIVSSGTAEKILDANLTVMKDAAKGLVDVDGNKVGGAGSGLDADMVDGKHASLVGLANTIPISDTNGALAGKNQCTAWAMARDDGTLISSYNISSVIVPRVGGMDFLFTDQMDNINYIVNVNMGRETTTSIGEIVVGGSGATYTSPVLNGFSVKSGNSPGTANLASVIVYVQVFGGKN